ncbi:hypothetical protein [Streptomyces sp. NPDC058701]|uniref:hypothetical protein n=1 Tax=Streptomyces sp. NPDC058701 TaxID=3346608 RepID=UPI003667D338
MHVRTAITTGAAAALLLTVTGCSNDAGTPAASSASAAPASSTASMPSPSPTPETPRAFGAPLNTTNSENQSAASVTVLGYEQGIKAHRTADEEFGTSGYVWAAIELKVCSTKGTVGVTRNPWVLAYTDGARIEPSSVTYDDFPRPEYPWEADIRNGDCLRGKTVFAVPGKQRPARVLYTSSVLPEPAEWAVPPQ